MPVRASKIPSLPAFALTLALGALGLTLTGCGGGASAATSLALPSLVPTTGLSLLTDCAAGYQIWDKAMEPLLTKLLAES